MSFSRAIIAILIIIFTSIFVYGFWGVIFSPAHYCLTVYTLLVIFTIVLGVIAIYIAFQISGKGTIPDLAFAILCVVLIMYILVFWYASSTRC